MLLVPVMFVETVEHDRVDAAAVVRRSGRKRPATVAGAVRATRAVRRENRNEAAVDRTTVAEPVTAPAVFGTAGHFARVRRAARAVVAVRRARRTNRVDAALNPGVTVRGLRVRYRFASRDRVARAVGNGREVFERAATERAATGAVPFGGNLGLFVVLARLVRVDAVAVANDVVRAPAAVKTRLRRVAVRRAKDAVDNGFDRGQLGAVFLGRAAFPNVRATVVNVFVDRLLFDVREDFEGRRPVERVAVPAVVRVADAPRLRRRHRVVRVVIVLNAEAPLLEVVRALHTTRRFASRLDGRKKQTDQNTDDRDNDQQFDERKAASFFQRFRH